MRKNKVLGVNKKWFVSQLTAADISQAELGRQLGIDGSAVTLLLNGTRKLRLDEAAKISRILSVPIDDVFLNAGILTETENSRSTIKVSGYVDSKFTVHFEKPKNGVTTAPKPSFNAGKNITAVVVRGVPGMEGTLIYVNKIDEVHMDCLERLSIVKIVGAKHHLLRTVKRGKSDGLYSLGNMSGDLISTEQDKQLEIACPVVWMKLS